MDSIIEAVERARRERPQGNRHRALVLKPIEYTQTRVVEVPIRTLKENRILTGGEEASHYKVLRTRVVQRMRQNGWKTLGITSPGPNEGKTLTSINLSIGLAKEEHHTVLLVDADLRRPSVHARLRLGRGKGLADHLLEGTDVPDILIHPSITRLVVLPGGQPQRNSSELLSSPRMLQLVDELRNRYPSRLVVFDLPPVLAGDDVIAFAPYLDAVLLVAEEGKTGIKELGQAAELLQGTELLGSVLNKSSEPAQGYGYY